MQIKLIYRIVNISISDKIQLSDVVYLRNVSSEEIHRKYPVTSVFLSISKDAIRHWGNHCVEAVYELELLEKELQELKTGDGIAEYITKVITPIILTRLFQYHHFPYATHCRIETPNMAFNFDLGFKGYKYVPRIIHQNNQGKISALYKFYELAQTDKVLLHAVDRFLIAMKRPLNHYNRINSPLWDKMVDYVISLETILLTIAGNSLDSELSYRFKMNGVALLSKKLSVNKQNIFKVLGLIYTIRSKVVHGGADDEILKAANKIITILKIDKADHQHGIGRLMILSSLMEEWIIMLFMQLSEIEKESRPYNKQGGWENEIWNK